MKASVLFSGGKDSSLSAILLEPFFEIELVTCTFGVLPVGEVAREAAERLGFAHRVLGLDRKVLEVAYGLLMRDGFPRSAINCIHHAAVETLACEKDVSIVVDGVRRDDRVPVLTIGQSRSIEDRLGIKYMCPLKGYGRSAVDLLVSRHLEIKEGQSSDVIKADYETELREIVLQRHDGQMIGKLFPSHVQSHVVGRKT